MNNKGRMEFRNEIRCIIIGAGPGGIFSAYEMVQRSKDVKIAVFEAGHALDKRHCPIDGVKVKSCVNCKSCSIIAVLEEQALFQMVNTTLRMHLAERCMNILEEIRLST